MRITVVGLGYVGLVTAGCLAEWNHHVIGIEADTEKLADLARGQLPFHEPGLDSMVKSHLHDGRLTLGGLDDIREAASRSDLVIVAVGTHDGNGGWQTETMRKALAGLVPHLAAGTPLIVRSTLPPEFIHQLSSIVASLRGLSTPDTPILLNPEFTQEGRAVSDFMHPSRVICGVVHDPEGTGTDRVRRLFDHTGAPFAVMAAINASFAKLGSNLFLATKISFANELAALCDAYGAQVDEVVDAMALDPRIGRAFLGAGVGFGGSCLPHQVTMTVKTARVAGLPTPLLAAVDDINHAQRAHIVGRLERLLPDGLGNTRIALLGLTFKPDTDDLRDAPSLTVARLLLERGASVVAYDPMERSRERAAKMMSGLEVVDSVDDALRQADAAVLVTEWAEFRELSWTTARANMRRPIVVDGRNCLDADALVAAGFTYTGFGRGWGAPAPESIASLRRAEPVSAEVA
jgi:UDPglucose 6-dehydrogenase